jgi:phenylalanyl-tRNA synthetase beta chain
MKVSRTWLQTYFETPLPPIEELALALTFHAFEIEDVVGDVMDVKVLPDRAAYALSHRGIATEISGILGLPLSHDPLYRPEQKWEKDETLNITLDTEGGCDRYIGALIEGVAVGPSPDWLRDALVSVGQRSINNIVDATNYVMLNIGQPLHAFDARKLAKGELGYEIVVRGAKHNEKITTLTGEEYILPERTPLITDGVSKAPLGIAGVKGGKHAQVDGQTTDIIIESAHFDGSRVRRTAQDLKLYTDASLRYQNHLHSGLTGFGMYEVLTLIEKVAGGKIRAITDTGPVEREAIVVTVTAAEIAHILGRPITTEEVESVLKKLTLFYKKEDGVLRITPLFVRTDIRILEDIAEEVGRILGYDTIEPIPLPVFTGVIDQHRFNGIERMKDQLVEQGYTEVSTQTFAPSGDVELLNPLDKTMPALRTSLEDNIKQALVKAQYSAPVTFGPTNTPKLFEVGTVFPKTGEYVELRMSERVEAWGDQVGIVDNLSIAKLEEYGKEYTPVKGSYKTYKPFSIYPFMTRDIALWTPKGTDSHSVRTMIAKEAGVLLVRIDQFDTFTKEERTSYAYRLVFESMEKTLSDEEVNPIMERITTVLNTTAGFEVR